MTDFFIDHPITASLAALFGLTLGFLSGGGAELVVRFKAWRRKSSRTA